MEFVPLEAKKNEIILFMRYVFLILFKEEKIILFTTWEFERFKNVLS